MTGAMIRTRGTYKSVTDVMLGPLTPASWIDFGSEDGEDLLLMIPQ
jgi:hypothetical protein